MTRIRTPRDIGMVIREARRRLGLSQAALARRINSTQTWVSWIENGKSTAEIGSVLLALAALGVEMDVRLPPPDGTARADAGPRDDDGADVPPYRL